MFENMSFCNPLQNTDVRVSSVLDEPDHERVSAALHQKASSYQL
jgi:hypothetical protein